MKTTVDIEASQQSVYYLSWSPIHCTRQPKWPPKLASPPLKTVYLTWTLQPPPPQLAASGLFNSCLVPFLHSGPLLLSYESLLPAPPPCLPSPFLLPLPPPPTPSSFLSTPLPVALQISGGRQCQTFQLFKQVSGWCRVPAGVALPLWCPTSLVCANPPESAVPKGAAGPELYWCSAERRWIYMHFISSTPFFFHFRLLHCWKENGSKAWWKDQSCVTKAWKYANLSWQCKITECAECEDSPLFRWTRMIQVKAANLWFHLLNPLQSFRGDVLYIDEGRRESCVQDLSLWKTETRVLQK